MTCSQCVAGCLVILAAIAGCAFTASWSERKFSSPERAEAPRTHTCVTVDGKRFEWNFPNPPFDTLRCLE